MRLHETLLIVAALFAPALSLLWFPWWAPVVALVAISLPLVVLTGWLIDHTYG